MKISSRNAQARDAQKTNKKTEALDFTRLSTSVFCASAGNLAEGWLALSGAPYLIGKVPELVAPLSVLPNI